MTTTPPYQVTNPATGEVTQKFDYATDAEIEAALQAATDAAAEWRRRPVADRAAVVKRVAELFTERSRELAELITNEMGKRPAAAVGEAEFCTDIFGYYVDNSATLHGRPAGAGARQRAHRVPPGRADPRGHALELPVLPGGPVRRARPDRRQHRHRQARRELPDLGPGDRARS